MEVGCDHQFGGGWGWGWGQWMKVVIIYLEGGVGWGGLGWGGQRIKAVIIYSAHTHPVFHSLPAPPISGSTPHLSTPRVFQPLALPVLFEAAPRHVRAARAPPPRVFSRCLPFYLQHLWHVRLELRWDVPFKVWHGGDEAGPEGKEVVDGVGCPLPVLERVYCEGGNQANPLVVAVRLWGGRGGGLGGGRGGGLGEGMRRDAGGWAGNKNARWSTDSW